MFDIAIISLSPVKSDPRVLRQIQMVLGRGKVLVMGFGDEPPIVAGRDDVVWVQLPLPRKTLLRFIVRRAGCIAGLVIPSLSLKWTEIYPPIVEAAAQLRRTPARCVVANEITGLIIACEGATAESSIIFDAHEYYPEESPGLWSRIMDGLPSVHALKKYLPLTAVRTTVCSPIAQRYEREFGWQFSVVRNIPLGTFTPRSSEPPRGTVRMIHHGIANRTRKLESMIDVIGLADSRFHLDLMLVGDSAYLKEIQAYAEKTALGRVRLREPVPTAAIVETIADYDIGFFLCPPKPYNNLVCLPNKLFEFLRAGLAVIIGPSPAMAEIVTETGSGLVGDSFDPVDIAALLNSLKANDILAMKRAAAIAGERLSGEAEMEIAISFWREALLGGK